MSQEFSSAFYNSPSWKKARTAYARSVGMVCEDCKRRGLIVAGEIVHHVQPLTPDNINDPSVTLAWSNLRLLCRDCHGRIHSQRNIRYVFDDAGNLIET